MIPRVWPLITGVLLVFQAIHTPRYTNSHETGQKMQQEKKGQDMQWEIKLLGLSKMC
jgi:hypothetical protein